MCSRCRSAYSRPRPRSNSAGPLGCEATQAARRSRHGAHSGRRTRLPGPALEQAGAHIVKHRPSFARYLEKWQQQRDKVLAWFDPRLMQYPSSIAITWQTSFDRPANRSGGSCSASPGWRLSWFRSRCSRCRCPPEPAEVDPYDDLSELEAYSLVARAADTPSFSASAGAGRAASANATIRPARCWPRRFNGSTQLWWANPKTCAIGLS